MKKCKECQTDIDLKAKRCPNCKADQRSWFSRHKILTGLGALILLGIIIGATGGSKNSAKTDEGSSTQPQTAMAVDVKAFGDEFEANQVAAEAKYKNKLVQLTAPISNISDSGLSFQNVTSKEFSLTQISCEISDKNALLTLKNGDSVTVKGKVTGQTVGVIGMSGCSIVK